jgi:hypothetical protein
MSPFAHSSGHSGPACSASCCGVMVMEVHKGGGCGLCLQQPALLIRSSHHCACQQGPHLAILLASPFWCHWEPFVELVRATSSSLWKVTLDLGEGIQREQGVDPLPKIAAIHTYLVHPCTLFALISNAPLLLFSCSLKSYHLHTVYSLPGHETFLYGI